MEGLYIGPAEAEEIARVSTQRDEVDRQVGQARLRWFRDRTPENLERWREALLQQRKTDEDYWEVTGPYL
jgi:hypothetical protein